MQRRKASQAALVANSGRSGRFMSVYVRQHQDGRTMLYAAPDKAELKEAQQTKANKMVSSASFVSAMDGCVLGITHVPRCTALHAALDKAELGDVPQTKANKM